APIGGDDGRGGCGRAGSARHNRAARGWERRAMSDIAIANRLQARWLALPGNTRGAVWMVAAGVGFTVMAVAIKLLGTELDSFQVAFFRILFGFIVILPI